MEANTTPTPEKLNFKDKIKIEIVKLILKFNSVTIEMLSTEFPEIPLCVNLLILSEMLSDKSIEVIYNSSPRAFKLKTGDSF